jgi:hypothetical protein
MENPEHDVEEQVGSEQLQAPEFIQHFPITNETPLVESSGVKKKAGRRKIPIEYIDDKSRRQITFSKRKAGLMKKVTFLLQDIVLISCRPIP